MSIIVQNEQNTDLVHFNTKPSISLVSIKKIRKAYFEFSHCFWNYLVEVSNNFLFMFHHYKGKWHIGISTKWAKHGLGSLQQ